MRIGGWVGASRRSGYHGHGSETRGDQYVSHRQILSGGGIGNARILRRTSDKRAVIDNIKRECVPGIGHFVLTAMSSGAVNAHQRARTTIGGGAYTNDRAGAGTRKISSV
jgi:hypothetical protein